MNKRTIAILGVDGSGKSSAVELVGSHYGKNCTVTYMGFRRFEDSRIEALQNKKKRNILDTLIILWLTYRCFWLRYIKSTKKGGIILFDRYVHEGFINANGRFKNLRVLLFKYLFPRPKRMVYLYCSIDESLRRKDDIESREVFAAMKKRFDDYFIGRPGVLCLDTERLSREKVAELIISFIDKGINNEQYKRFICPTK